MSVRTVATYWKQKKSGEAEVGRAAKVSERNWLNVVLWANGETIPTSSHRRDLKFDPRIKLKTREGVRVARPGDVIIKFKDATTVVIKAKDWWH